MSFCTVLNCIDGRVQIPVIDYLKNKFNIDYADCITEPAPNLVLYSPERVQVKESVIKRIDISINQHSSSILAIAAHHDCAANPAGREIQINQLKVSIKWLQLTYPDIQIIGLWVDENWEVNEIDIGE